MTPAARFPALLSACFLALLPVCADRAVAQKRTTVTFESHAVGRTMAYDVLLPAHYETSQKRYPVLYLLHGHGGHHRVWGLPLPAPWHSAAQTRESWVPRDLIIVMPDAGNSWYVNWQAAARAAVDGHPDRGPGPSEGPTESWEDYIVIDLIDHVDGTFRTLPTRAGRAIAGFSMGGYGAITLGIRHADRFTSAASISGYLGYARAAWQGIQRGPRGAPRRRERPAALRRALDQKRAETDSAFAVAGFRSQIERTPSGRTFTTIEAAQAHDPFMLVESTAREQLPSLHLACGTEDSLFNFTRELAESLLARRIPFSYWQARGGHDAEFRTRALAHLAPRLRGEMTSAVRDHQETPLNSPHAKHHHEEETIE